MPDDPILDPAGEVKPNGADSPVTPAAASQADLDALREQVSKSAEAVTDLSQTIKAAMQNQAPVTPPKEEPTDPEPDADETLRELAADPDALIRKLGREEIDKVRRELFEPQMRTVFEAQHQQILATEKSKVDAEYGDGVWEDKFLPALEPFYNRLRTEDPAKLADANYIEANIGVIGYKIRDDLAEAKTKTTKTAEEKIVAEREALVKTVSALPSGTFRRTASSEDELSDETKTALLRIEEHGGGAVDHKEFAKLQAAGNSYADYLDATGQTEKKVEVFGA